MYCNHVLICIERIILYLFPNLVVGVLLVKFVNSVIS